MIKLDTILCPVDMSDISVHAYEHAVALARWYKARLHVLEAAGVVALPIPAEAAVPAYGVPFEMRRAFAEELDRLVEPARTSGLAVEATFVEGGIVSAILESAKTLPADLIVMGTHGRSGFDRFVLGSVTEKVIRKAECPVLTVPPHEEGGPAEPAFMSIVCAVDFSDASMRGLEYGLSLAREAGGRIVLFHAYDWPVEPGFSGEMAAALAASRTDWEAIARERLTKAVPQSARTSCEIETVLGSGSPGGEILRVASEHKADLIVLGAYGRSALERAVFGSATHRVIREATCPVLTVRA